MSSAILVIENVFFSFLLTTYLIRYLQPFDVRVLDTKSICCRFDPYTFFLPVGAFLSDGADTAALSSLIFFFFLLFYMGKLSPRHPVLEPDSFAICAIASKV